MKRTKKRKRERLLALNLANFLTVQMMGVGVYMLMDGIVQWQRTRRQINDMIAEGCPNFVGVSEDDATDLIQSVHV